MGVWIVLLALASASERQPLAADGKFEARAGKSVRVLVTAPATIRVNGLYAGETRGELDITGYLKTGSNEIRSSNTPVTLLFSPPVYLKLAECDGRTLRVAVVNTTENTVQVELDEQHQFTVSPGTTGHREVPATSAKSAHIRATSDGLDLIYEDTLVIARSSPSAAN